MHNRGRKSVLALHQRAAIETVENANFQFGTASHISIARSLGLANGGERAIQKNMAEHGVGTYMAQQKKFIRETSIEKRKLWGFERPYWKEDQFKSYRFTDECHFACGLQRQARIHRRRGKKHRNAPQKIQFRLKRQNQTWHVHGEIGWNFKGQLHFYTGTGVGGRLVQADYLVILEEVIAPHWSSDLILLEDNDNAHGTRSKGDNKIKKAKRRLGIKWESNPPESPDLNPMETI